MHMYKQQDVNKFVTKRVVFGKNNTFAYSLLIFSFMVSRKGRGHI